MQVTTNNDFEFYRDFHSVEQAEDFAKMLTEHGIPFLLEKSQTLLDAAIVGHGLVPPALVKVRSVDFPKVNEILVKMALENPHFLDSHYLRQLDDRELIDIVRNPDEWNVEDTAVARRILNERGIPIPREHVLAFTEKKNAELREGKTGHPGWMVAYLLLVLAGGVLVSPLFLLAGIGMGWYYWQDKTVDNQGGKFFTFEKTTRLYGKVIFYLGWLSLLVGGLLMFWLGTGKNLSESKRRNTLHKQTFFPTTLQENINSPAGFQIFTPFGLVVRNRQIYLAGSEDQASE